MKIIEKIPQELLDATNIFAKNLEWGRRLPIYEIHKWWARRYSGIIRLFLIYTYLDFDILRNVKDYHKFVSELYWNPPLIHGKSLLDPFCGGGTIIFEASKLGFKAYGIEINKLAYFILNSYKKISSINLYEFKNILINLANELNDKLWLTKCTKGHKATIIHTFLVWKNKKGYPQIKYNKIKDIDNERSIYYCEKCENVFEGKANIKHCPFCNNSFDKEKNERYEYHELYPYALEYYCQFCNERKIKKTNDEDISNFFYQAELNIPRVKIPNSNETKRLIKNGFIYFDELLTPRQKITFFEFLKRFEGTIYEDISKLIVSDSLRCCSLLAFYSPKYRKVIPGFVIRSYWMPIQPIELNPLSFKSPQLYPLGRGNLISSYRKVLRALSYNSEYLNNFVIYLGGAQDILRKFNKKIDIVFTDPPYVNYQFYSDLSLFSLSILEKNNENYIKYLLENEIVVRNRSEIRKYFLNLFKIFELIKRNLSSEGLIIVTFHHSDITIIKEFINIFKKLQLNLDAIYPVIGESSGKLTKRKLYIDLLFVFSNTIKKTHFAKTNIYFTSYDKLLIESISEIIRYYHEN